MSYKPSRLLLSLALCVLLWTVTPIIAQNSFGHFEGKVVASFAANGRDIILEKPYAYIDGKGRRWDVPAGLTTDGASIPQVFWIKYPPFTGSYRDAAVIHDYYCQTKSRSWQDTHDA